MSIALAVQTVALLALAEPTAPIEAKPVPVKLPKQAVCDAAERASSESGWKYTVDKKVPCDTQLVAFVPDDERKKKAGKWFETAALTAGLVLVETRAGTEVRERSNDMTDALERARSQCPQPKREKGEPSPFVPPLSASIQRSDGRVRVELAPDRANTGEHALCMKKALAREVPLPDAPSTLHVWLTTGGGFGVIGGLLGSTPVIVGSLDKDIIRRVVKEHATDPRSCYEAALKSKPSLAGKVVIKWTIDGEGKVTESNVEKDETGHEPLGACIVEKVRAWSFPKPKGGGVVKVTYPFVFKPAKDEAPASQPAPASP